MITHVEQAILDEVRKLKPDQQQQVLDFIRRLELPRGEPGWRLIQDAREIDFPADDLAEIAEAIEDCEKIDWDEWDLPA